MNRFLNFSENNIGSNLKLGLQNPFFHLPIWTSCKHHLASNCMGKHVQSHTRIFSRAIFDWRRLILSLIIMNLKCLYAIWIVYFALNYLGFLSAQILKWFWRTFFEWSLSVISIFSFKEFRTWLLIFLLSFFINFFEKQINIKYA
jgi:hypothetical protein